MRDLPIGFRLAIYAAILFFIILIYYFIFYSPKADRILEKQKRYEQLYNQIINIIPSTTIDKYNASIKELKLAKNLVGKLNKYLYEEMGEPNILYDELLNLASRNNVKIDVFETKNKGLEKVNDFTSKFVFDLILYGDFDSIVKFFYGLNSLKNIVHSESFLINTSTRKEAVNPTLQVKGSFSAYKYNLEKLK
ncbi:MAG: type 4a pilus biogenesis protein PilO [Deferribacterota bacterium]|nr:type 4a pilus biogenesis protein PilO [Deferribacterota bacterium]